MIFPWLSTSITIWIELSHNMSTIQAWNTKIYCSIMPLYPRRARLCLNRLLLDIMRRYIMSQLLHTHWLLMLRILTLTIPITVISMMSTVIWSVLLATSITKRTIRMTPISSNLSNSKREGKHRLPKILPRASRPPGVDHPQNSHQRASRHQKASRRHQKASRHQKVNHHRSANHHLKASRHPSSLKANHHPNKSRKASHHKNSKRGPSLPSPRRRSSHLLNNNKSKLALKPL